jgi:hypothetical protein
MNNCPVCDGSLVKVVYGYPTPTMLQRARNEEIALGGLDNQGYDYYCYRCNDTAPPTIWPTVTK